MPLTRATGRRSPGRLLGLGIVHDVTTSMDSYRLRSQVSIQKA
ncbi:MAG: hypothetical protein R3F17_12390 [Planctomycetota bacterium]